MLVDVLGSESQLQCLLWLALLYAPGQALQQRHGPGGSAGQLLQSLQRAVHNAQGAFGQEYIRLQLVQDQHGLAHSQRGQAAVGRVLHGGGADHIEGQWLRRLVPVGQATLPRAHDPGFDGQWRGLWLIGE